MRILIFLFVVTFLSTRAADVPYSSKDSGAAENLFARISYLTPGSTNLSTAEKISFCFLEKTNEATTSIVYFPKPEYFCQMQLLNGNGIAVPKTLAGEKYGGQFSELKIYSWESVNKKGHNTGGNDRPDMVFVHTNGATGIDFPSIQDLFKVKEAGDYKLSLQFQVFKMMQNGTNHTFKIVRIPLVEIPVNKTATNGITN